MAYVVMQVGFVVAIAAPIAVPAAIAIDFFVYVNVNASIDFKRFQNAVLCRIDEPHCYTFSTPCVR